jgi:hypothetical protein
MVDFVIKCIPTLERDIVFQHLGSHSHSQGPRMDLVRTNPKYKIWFVTRLKAKAELNYLEYRMRNGVHIMLSSISPLPPFPLLPDRDEIVLWFN